MIVEVNELGHGRMQYSADGRLRGRARAALDRWKNRRAICRGAMGFIAAESYKRKDSISYEYSILISPFSPAFSHVERGCGLKLARCMTKFRNH
jgi:hypothetical protein